MKEHHTFPSVCKQVRKREGVGGVFAVINIELEKNQRRKFKIQSKKLDNTIRKFFKYSYS